MGCRPFTIIMLSEILGIEFKTIPLNEIRIDPLLTPKALAIPRHIEADPVIKQKYIELASRFDYREPLKLGCIFDEKLNPCLLSNFECYEALQDLYYQNPSELVQVIVITFSDQINRKAVSTQLAALERGEQPYLIRLYELRQYIQLELDAQMIRRIYGIYRSASAEGKQLRRDMAIAKHDRFLSHILGNQADTIDQNTQSSQFLKPNLGNATLPYTFALRLLKILGSDNNAISEFLNHLETYLAELRKSHMSPEEETKPIHQWSAYNRTRIESFARAVAGSRSIPNYDAEQLADYNWDLRFDERSGAYLIPQTEFNVHDRSDQNMKRIVEIAYKANQLSKSLKAHIKRIRPVRHGSKLKIGDSSVEARIPISSNIPKLEDTEYLIAIREDKVLRFCNRSHFLRSTHLWPGIFGFESSEPNSVSTYESAHKGFENWYNNSFLADVFRYHQNNAPGHPFYSTYIAIQLYLSRRANDPTSITFSDFFNEVFSYVLTSHDKDYEAKKMRADEIVNYERDLKSVLWTELESALNDGKTITVDRFQLESLIRERIHTHERDVVRAISHQNQILSRILENPLLLTEDGQEIVNSKESKNLKEE